MGRGHDLATKRLRGPRRMHTADMRRRWLVTVVLGTIATGCGAAARARSRPARSKSQEQMFRQPGAESANKGSVVFGSDCEAAARAEVGSQAPGHPGWTMTQRKTYEAAFVDGGLPRSNPSTGSTSSALAIALTCRCPEAHTCR